MSIRDDEDLAMSRRLVNTVTGREALIEALDEMARKLERFSHTNPSVPIVGGHVVRKMAECLKFLQQGAYSREEYAKLLTDIPARPQAICGVLREQIDALEKALTSLPATLKEG